MQILIVDNATKYLEPLQQALNQHQLNIKDPQSIHYQGVDQADIVILTGGGKVPVEHHDRHYKYELSLIKRSAKPILGICLGFELIAHAFGAELELITDRERGEIEVKILPAGQTYFGGRKKIKVYENHRHVVKDVDSPLTELAKSQDGIEAIKHKDRPLLGVQFHPEKMPNSDLLEHLVSSLVN